MEIRLMDIIPQSAEQKYSQFIRSLTPGERLGMAVRLSEQMHAVMKDTIRAMHPDLTEEEVKRAFVEITLPPDLVKKAYGWD